MDTAFASRWSRRFVGTGVVFFVAWGFAAALGMGRRTEVSLLLFGFVLHTVFGKAYALLPTYFDRELAVSWAPALQFPLTVGATLALAASAVQGVPIVAIQVAAVLWALGVAVFLGTMLATIRGNLTGRETGTGEHNADRRAVDRAANAAVPVVFLYLLLGSYEFLAATLALPTIFGGAMAAISHLLAAGVGALLLFAVGFRLFPRFLNATPPRWLVYVVLPAGAIGPALVAAGLYGGPLLQAGAALQAIAVTGFALTYATLFVRSDNRRIGFYAVLAGMGAALLAVGLGVQFAVAGRDPVLVVAHYRLTLVGFLGLTIVGATMQFYPPSVGDWFGANDATATMAITLLAAGVVLQLFGVVTPMLAAFGTICALLGAVIHATLVFGAFIARPL